MNGAAMNYRQDPSIRPSHRDPSGLHNPGYHLQINHQQNLQPQNSKTMNYQSFQTNYQVDDYYDNLHRYGNNIDLRNSVEEVKDPRLQRPKPIKVRREPIDLPVPQFEIDEHSVINLNSNDASVQGSKGLDLDTRIGLLIKSKALAGMHPIFSDLNESEESESDSDDLFLRTSRSPVGRGSVQRDLEIPFHESFDDPEKPLSRPPSPFLSRATYLFWFNKAIEIKQQAKAQEQALLEQAAKRFSQDNSTVVKANQVDKPQKKGVVPKNVIDVISKELKEIIKQEFIREVIEQTAYNTLDVWWEKQNIGEEKLIVRNNINEKHEEKTLGESESQGFSSPRKSPSQENDTIHENNLKDGYDLKDTFCDEEMHIKEVPEENDDKCLCNTISIVDRRDTNSNKAPSEENPDQKPEEICQEIGEKHENNLDKVSISLDKCSSDISINYCVNEERSECINLLKTVRITGKICETEILSEQREKSPPSPSSLSIVQEDKFSIVQDVLDFIFNNMNNIILQRNDSLSHEKVDLIENLTSKNLPHLNTLDSLSTDIKNRASYGDSGNKL